MSGHYNIIDDNIDILLSRYFAGETSDEEQQCLDKWLSESEENEKYFEEMTQIFQYSAQLPPIPEINVDNTFAAFKEHMEKGNKTIRKTIFQKYASYFSAAASVVLLIGVAVFIFKGHDGGEHVNLTAENGIVKQSMFEGIDVTLSEGTVLAYNPKNKKEIVLKKGEATFNVQSSDGEKLKIQVGDDVFVEDIGTVFSVIANNPEKSVTVEVTEGEIWFYTKNNTGIHIKQSEKGIYHVKENSFEHILLKREDMSLIEFNGTPIQEVIELLSAHYHVSITTDSEALSQKQISASFNPNETIDNILAIIADTWSIHVNKKTDGVYVLSN